MTWSLRSHTDRFGAPVGRLAGDASARRCTPDADASDDDPRPRVVMSCATFGTILLTGQRRLDALVEALAAWGEVQDIIGLESGLHDTSPSAASGLDALLHLDVQPDGDAWWEHR